MEYLFVYGTLKRGQANHRYLKGAEFIGEGESVEKFVMFDIGVPVVTRDKKVASIKGELYRVSPEILKRCDKLEGHPRYYRREKVKVVVKGEEFEAWMYLWIRPVRDGILVEDGEWKG